MEEINELTELVIGAAIEVHRYLGPGLLESVYQHCMEMELKLRNCSVEPQARIPLIYKGVTLADPLVIDLYFPSQLVVELKSVEKVLPVHDAQLLSYMKLTKTKIGLLLNFNVATMKQGIKRFVI
jgi:GxxExxY protein